MRYLFIIQGEGRGHLTQALALSQILRKEGHEVCRVIVGKSKRREVPAFFSGQIGAPIDQLDSPNFVTDKQQKSVRLFATIVHAILNGPAYRRSLRALHAIVQAEKPDVIVNFYDFLGGLYGLYRRPRCRITCIAHQFLMAHPDFDFPEKRWLDRISVKLGNRIARSGADKVLALSFQPFDDVPEKDLYVVPPLLRAEIRSLEKQQGDHFLVYMVNAGYAAEVDQFHAAHKEVPLHCFWDKKDAPKEWPIDETLTYHQLDDKKFLACMASSRGYVTTAGFESVCEAMYLGKPVLMVPVAGHYEQACNAIDARKAGAGIYSDTFEIDKLAAYLPKYKDVSVWFRKWADRAPEMFSKHIS